MIPFLKDMQENSIEIFYSKCLENLKELFSNDIKPYITNIK